MTRGPNEQILKAQKLFDAGMSLINIANELGISAGTVRSWKSRYGWGAGDAATLRKKMQRCKDKNRNVAKADEASVEAVIENEDLTDKQQLFCVLYAKTPNATQAYMKAYDCTYETALRSGPRLLGNVGIKNEIKRLKKLRFENQLFDEHDIFQWYLDVATASITDYVDFGREKIQVIGAFGPLVNKETGDPITKEINYVKFRQASQVNGQIIKKIKLGKDGASIELYDAMAAMKWLSEHMTLGTSSQQKLAEMIMGAYQSRTQDESGTGDDNAGAE